MTKAADRVKETTTTTGTGIISLAGAPTGFQSFVSGIGDGNGCAYVITDGTDWETGYGTVAAGTPDTLSRDTITDSSNAGAAVNWGSGSKDVFNDFIAADADPSPSDINQEGATNGQAIVWNSSTGQWEPQTAIITPSIQSPPDDGISGPSVKIQGTVFGALYESDTRNYREFQVDLSTGDFSSPVVDVQSNTDSCEATGLSYNTQYKARIRDVGNSGYTTAWSSTISFTASESTIYGIALVSTGGGAGTWQRIDANGNNISLSQADFDNHPVIGGISNVTIDSQAMVEIPKFYVKQDVAPAGSDQAGKKCWWVSNSPFPGASIHPAFKDSGVEIDQVYVGKYECTDDGGTKAGSVAGVAPLVSIDFPTMQTRCEARNEANGGNAGVSGFRMWGIYELAALQILSLIELGTPDVQSAIASGRASSSSAANTGTTSAVWRGVYELWGNVWGMTDGLQIDGSHQVQIWDTSGNLTLQSTGVTTTNTNGWALTLHDESGTDWDLSLVMLPKTVDTTESNGTLGDYLYASDAGEQNICYSGGHWSIGSSAGLFVLYLGLVSSHSTASFGSRLAKV